MTLSGVSDQSAEQTGQVESIDGNERDVSPPSASRHLPAMAPAPEEPTVAAAVPEKIDDAEPPPADTEPAPAGTPPHPAPASAPADPPPTPAAAADSTTPEPARPAPTVQRVGFTLDILEGKLDEYVAHHAQSRPEVVKALRSVGLRNLSLWAWQNRLFYYAEYVGTLPFAEAMDEYATKPGVAEWEALMHSYQAKIPGTDPQSDVWWQPCTQVYYQS